MDAGGVCRLFGFDVEIKENFDVIGDKTDGDKKNIFYAAGGFPPDDIANIRLQPGILGAAAPAGIAELPLRPAEFPRDQSRPDCASFPSPCGCLDRRHGGQPFGDIVNTFRKLCGEVRDAIRGKICDVAEG